MTEALQKAETSAVVAMPKNTVALAIEKGMDPATISKLMDLQERWEANQARKDFTDAMSLFKAECPAVIGKDRKADFGAGKAKYSYATTGQIVKAITPALSKNGLSLSWETEQKERTVTVTCHVTHCGGHRESATLTGPHDESGGKNPIQMLGSSVHYLQRYTMVSVLGLATADMDDPDERPHREPVAEPRARTAAPAEQPPAMPANGETKTVTGTVVNVSRKPAANGSIRFGVMIDAAWYNTFDEKLGELAEGCKGQKVTAFYTTNAKGYHDLSDITQTPEA